MKVFALRRKSQFFDFDNSLNANALIDPLHCIPVLSLFRDGWFWRLCLRRVARRWRVEVLLQTLKLQLLLSCPSLDESVKISKSVINKATSVACCWAWALMQAATYRRFYLRDVQIQYESNSHSSPAQSITNTFASHTSRFGIRDISNSAVLMFRGAAAEKKRRKELKS